VVPYLAVQVRVFSPVKPDGTTPRGIAHRSAGIELTQEMLRLVFCRF
jgi:hypothetical protein